MGKECDFLTEFDVAKRLGFSVKTIRAWRARGDGPPYYKVVRAIRYDPAKVERWLKDTEVTGSTKGQRRAA
jgi:hypothetical protein